MTWNATDFPSEGELDHEETKISLQVTKSTMKEDDGLMNIPEEVTERRRRECEELHSREGESHDVNETKGLYCPWTFDGWSCWNDTPAGATAFTNCPEFVVGFDPLRQGHKVCTSNGTWFTHPDNSQPWSNYTGCVDLSRLEFHQTVNHIYLVGYSVSLAALVISLVIFFRFRSLKCKRVTIHKNLFSSFVVNNIMWLIWHHTVVAKPEVVADNQMGCQILHVLLHYFLVSNYFWMFCEGLYLHTLLVVAFVKEDKIIMWFLLVGWGIPAVLTMVYSSARACDYTHNTMCWMEESPYNYILSIPVVLSMLVNCFFLINIITVLVTKMRAANAPQDNHATRKAVRATLILIPLLGLHYILMPLKPPVGSPLESSYLITSAACSSFQGLSVALLFCFFNGEVIAIFKKKWNQRRMMRSPNSYAATTVSFVKNSMVDGVTLTTNYGAAHENSVENV